MQLNGNIIERENSLKFLSVIIERHVGAKGEGGREGVTHPPSISSHYLERFSYEVNLNQQVT